VRFTKLWWDRRLACLLKNDRQDACPTNPARNTLSNSKKVTVHRERSPLTVEDDRQGRRPSYNIGRTSVPAGHQMPGKRLRNLLRQTHFSSVSDYTCSFLSRQHALALHRCLLFLRACNPLGQTHVAVLAARQAKWVVSCDWPGAPKRLDGYTSDELSIVLRVLKGHRSTDVNRSSCLLGHPFRTD